jgi:hypothetical protein
VGTGEQQEKFVLHKKLLCSKAPVFGKMFNSGFQESLSQSATLPEDDPKVFALFVDWVYLNTLPVLPVAKTPKVFPTSFTALFAFSEKYCIVQLCDNTMDTIVQVGKQGNMEAGCFMMEDGYRKTRPGSRLRLYLLRSYVYLTKVNSPVLPWPPEKFYMVALRCNELLFNFFAETTSDRDSKKKTTARSPNAFPRCDYHQHGKDQECPYSYEGDALAGLKKSELANSSLTAS